MNLREPVEVYDWLAEQRQKVVGCVVVCGVDAALPYGVRTRESIRMELPDESLPKSVVVLLFDVCLERCSPVMQYLGGRIILNYVSCLLQSPFDIDIVTTDPEHFIESAYLLQDGSLERHVAAGYVIRDCVVDKYVRWTARRPGGAFRQERIFGGV